MIKNVKNIAKTMKSLFALAVALNLMIICGATYSYSQTEKINAAGRIISPEQMREDLDYLVQKLKNVHPSTYKGFSQQQQSIIEEAYKQIIEPVSTSRFFFVVSAVIASLNDAHSLVYLEAERCINLPIVSFKDGFYIRQSTEHFQKGDKVISLGSMTADSIFQKLKYSISAENDQWRKAFIELWISVDSALGYLNLIDNDSVAVTVSRDGAPVTEKTPLEPCKNIDWSYRKIRDPFVGYTIYSDHSLGVLYIDRCINDDYYRNTLHSFFSEVAENKIKNIAVDLRRNHGGNSGVIMEFLTYFNIDKFKRWGVEMRFSSETAETKEATNNKLQKDYVKTEPGNYSNKKLRKDSKLLFKGNLFVMTSMQTFSSAATFATVIKDNRLGTIIGEPTGNAPSIFGELLGFNLPNSEFAFSVPYKKITRPKPDNNPQDALYPDIPVYTTRDDLLLDRDPQLERIKNIIKKRR